MFEVIMQSALALFTEEVENGYKAGLTSLLEAERTISDFGRELPLV